MAWAPRESSEGAFAPGGSFAPGAVHPEEQDTMTVLVESTGRAEVRRRGSPCDQLTLDASGCRPVHVFGGNTCTRFAWIACFKRGGRMLFPFLARCESGWNHGRAEDKELAEKDREGAFNTGGPDRALTAQDIFRPKRQSLVSPPIERTIQAARCQCGGEVERGPGGTGDGGESF